MIYLAIDIGQKGAIVALVDHGEDELTILRDPMPLTEDKVLDVQALFKYLQEYEGKHMIVIFEDITTLHAASKSSNFKLALQAGAIKMACIALKFSYRAIPPKSWQNEMFKELPPVRKKDGSSDTKTLSYIAAKKYFPDVKIQKSKDGENDALLMAGYARRLNQNQNK